MAHNPQLSNAGVNAGVNAVTALLNNGFLDIYTTPQPANADTALGAQVLLASLTFGATAFGAAVAGVATANAIGSDVSADASGTAVWFRAYKSDHTTVVFDGSVGTSGADLNLSTTTITMGQTVSVTSFTYTGDKA